MDREHAKGLADKAKGAIKEGAGKAGDKERRAKERSIRPRAPLTRLLAT
jgi:uncharacterized protein YjbJ (UPF0337 family)